MPAPSIGLGAWSDGSLATGPTVATLGSGRSRLANRLEPPTGQDVLPLREALDGDTDRGVAVFSSDLRLLYANPFARASLRDHADATGDGALPASVGEALDSYRDRIARSPSAQPPDEIVLEGEGSRRARVQISSLTQSGRRFFVVRLAPSGLFAEPSVRRLQTRFGFTVRESQVALAVAKGLTNAETAAHLGITEKTVKNALMAVYAKCGARNRVELALKAHDAPFERPRAPLHPPASPE